MNSPIAFPSKHNNRPPSLFDAAERCRVRRLPLAARRLAQRHGFLPTTALVIAELAGFQLEVDR